MNPLEPYRPSGRVGPAVLAVPIAAGIVAVLMGAIYSAITIYVPIVGVVTVIALAVVGFALAVVASIFLRMAKSRNRWVDHAVGLFTGAVGLYSAWGFFLYFLVGDIHLLEAFNPLLIGLAALELGKTGWYELKGASPSGAFLYGLWAIEAAVFLLVPMVFARLRTRGPFCEKGGTWADDEQAFHVVGANLGVDLAAMVREWRVDDLLALEPWAPPSNTLHILQGTSCSCCSPAFSTIGVTKVVLSQNNKGEVEKNATEVVPPHVIDAEQLQLLVDMVAEAAQQAEAEAAAVEEEPRPEEPVDEVQE